jgi:hypothetical protein
VIRSACADRKVQPGTMLGITILKRRVGSTSRLYSPAPNVRSSHCAMACASTFYRVMKIVIFAWTAILIQSIHPQIEAKHFAYL